MKTKTIKIKHIKPHTNFAEEIYHQEKTDKFFNRIFYTGCVLAGIALIILVIVNIK
jgi:hypothetical protein